MQVNIYAFLRSGWAGYSTQPYWNHINQPGDSGFTSNKNLNPSFGKRTTDVSHPPKSTTMASNYSSKGSSSSMPYQTKNCETSFRRLIDAELAHWRAKGMCFKCDERYGPNHVCKNQSLHVLLLGDESQAEDVEKKTDVEMEGEEEDQPTCMKLSMHSTLLKKVVLLTPALLTL